MVPERLAALSFCVLMPMAWKRKLVDLVSPVTAAILDPTSLRNFMAIGQKDPRVSMVTGMIL